MGKIKHGLTKHPLYGKWQDMKNRCYNEKVDRFYRYGALGITVCEEWKNNFKCFYDWSVENGWSKGLSIERNDLEKGYCPENCKYITLAEQHYNKTTTKWVVYNGEKYCLADICKKLNLTQKQYYSIWYRMKKGDQFEFAVTQSLKKLEQ